MSSSSSGPPEGDAPAERELIAELAAAREQVLVESDHRTRLLSSLAHELRAPLLQLATLASTIDDTALPAAQANAVAQVRSGLDDLSAALDRMLGSTRTTAVDGAVIEELAHDIGNRAVVVGMVRTFLNELHGRRVALTTAAERGDVMAARSVAHLLKSSALLLGANDVGRACEQLSSAEDADLLPQLVADVMQTSAVAARWYQNWLSSEPTPR